MEARRRAFPEFTSALTRTEAALVLAYFPVHILVLPMLLQRLLTEGAIGAAAVNPLFYGVGFAYMLAVGFRFLRRSRN